MVSGHKRKADFAPYNVVNDTDLRLAAQKQQEYLAAQMVTKKLQSGDFGPKKSLKEASQYI
jgi:hypothetical protein